MNRRALAPAERVGRFDHCQFVSDLASPCIARPDRSALAAPIFKALAESLVQFCTFTEPQRHPGFDPQWETVGTAGRIEALRPLSSAPRATHQARKQYSTRSPREGSSAPKQRQNQQSGKPQSTRTNQERPVTPKTAQTRGQLFSNSTSHGARDSGVLLGSAPSAARASPAAGRKAAGGIVCSQVTLPTLRTVVPLHRG